MKDQLPGYTQLRRQFSLQQDEPMSRHTSFRVGGPADLFAQPVDRDELQALLTAAKKHHIPVTLLGSGTNLLITDKGIRGLVITTRKLKTGVRIFPGPEKGDHAGMILETGAGERLAKVARIAAENGLSGLEFTAGIPGTIGGAVFMNAGIPGKEMAGIVRSVDLLETESFNMETRLRDQIYFTYRSSGLTGIILGLSLTLRHRDKNRIKQTMLQNLDKKSLTQPMGMASAGCFFKNPAHGEPAGKLIEEAGLKGFRVNDARISDIHANYIVNTGKASCDDILLLKQIVQTTIMKKYRIKLETEVRVEGE